MSCEEGEIGSGEGERMDSWTVLYRRLWIETSDTVPGEWDLSEGEEWKEGDEEDKGYLGDSEQMDDDDEADEEDWVNGEDEKLLADRPVAIHEVKTRTEEEATLPL